MRKIGRAFSLILLAILLPGFFTSAAAADVSGEWKISLDFLFGDAEHIAVFEQNGDELSGIYKGEFKEGRLRGRMNGNTIEFTGFLKHEASSLSYHYTGTVSGNTMTGTVEMGEYWSASWKAVKAR